MHFKTRLTILPKDQIVYRGMQ